MKPLQKSVLIVAGIFVWMFALSAGLAWYQFGYLDEETVIIMGGLLLPVLGAALLVLAWASSREALKRARTLAAKAQKSVAGKPGQKSEGRPVAAGRALHASSGGSKL